MRGERLLLTMLLAASLGLCGCTGTHAARSDAGATAAASPARAPQDADLAAVMERFYQLIEGEHWEFADAMLTPGFHTILGMDGVRPRYQDLADIDVTLQQTGASTVVAHLTAKQRGDPSRIVHVVEIVRLFDADGQWAIDSIARRDVSPGTR